MREPLQFFLVPNTESILRLLGLRIRVEIWMILRLFEAATLQTSVALRIKVIIILRHGEKQIERHTEKRWFKTCGGKDIRELRGFDCRHHLETSPFLQPLHAVPVLLLLLWNSCSWVACRGALCLVRVKPQGSWIDCWRLLRTFNASANGCGLVQGKAIYKSAAAMAAALGGSYLSVLPASTSALPFLSPQNAVQLAQAKQGTTSYGFHHRRAQGEGCDCSVLPASASSFSFSTVFDSNSRKLRMHWKPKSKWLHDREGIAVEVRIEEFSSDDFEVERLLGSYGYINVSRYTIGLGSSLSFASFWEPRCRDILTLISRSPGV